MPSPSLQGKARSQIRKRAVGSASLLASLSLIVSCACSAPIETAVTVETTKLKMGTNLDGVAYYATAQPFLDVWKTGGGWNSSNVDEHGWVKSLAPGATLGTGLLVENPAAPPNTRYVVLFEGEGKLTAWHDTKVIESAPGRLVVESGAAGDIRLSLTSTDPNGDGNYIRNISVVQEKFLPLFQAGSIFNPEWLEKVDELAVHRFMDWMLANDLFNKDGNHLTVEEALKTNLLNWDDRPKATDSTWVKHGVPVELMVELSNRLGSDMWVNMPTNASDDYVRGFATYVQENLRSDLKVHVEFSNEVWNWGFVQTQYANAKAKELLGPTSGAVEWYGMRTAQVGQIWNEVFGEAVKGGDTGRVSVVFATQAAWHGLETYGLETVNWKDAAGNHIRAADYFDEYAITGYYYGTALEQDPAAKLLEWSKDPDGFTKAIAAIREEVDGWVAGNYRYHAGKADAHGFDLVTYESGSHVATPHSLRENAEFVKWIIELNKRPELYQIETQNFENFRKAGGDLFMNFAVIGAPSKWGSWSLLEKTEQEGSPRYDALMDYVRGRGR